MDVVGLTSVLIQFASVDDVGDECSQLPGDHGFWMILGTDVLGRTVEFHGQSCC